MRSWLVRYRIGKRQRFVTLGKVAELDALEARKHARQILYRATEGYDAQAERQARKAKASASPTHETFGGVATIYLEHAASSWRLRSRAERERYLLRDWAMSHKRPLVEITRREIAACLFELAKSKGPIAANRARSTLSTFFVWAMGQGMAEANPVAGTMSPGQERARERTLTALELRALWRATEGAGEYNTIVRLLLLTGQRREEVAALRWDEIDFERVLWLLPGTRTKNKRAHEVPLSEQVLVILHDLPRREGRALLFGQGSGPFSGWSQSKARLDKRMHEALAATVTPATAATSAPPLMPWVLHDLRRTAVTGMAEIGISPHVIEAVVNQISGHKAGVAGVYNRATYAKEKREALRAWAEHVLQVVTIEAA